MNKKGFTLFEVIMVVIILGIISAITLPGIMDSLGNSKRTSGENIEKMLKENLKLYKTDNNITDIESVTFQELKKVNNDIDLGECCLQDENSLQIIRSGSDPNYTYEYIARIKCGSGNTLNENGTCKNEGSSQYYTTPGIEQN